MDKSKEEPKITREEFERIEKAMKDKEFRDLFFEYAKEISDPENRKLYEEEITILEKQKGMNVNFIKPEPGYVLKSSELGKSNKVFVNICSSEFAEKATASPKKNQNKIGFNWSVPHVLVPPREDMDKAKKNCTVFDVAFHPSTLATAFKDTTYRNMLNEIAIENIEKKFGVQIDKKNLKFPKMKYKGIPQPTVIRTPSIDGEKCTDDLRQDFPPKFCPETNSAATSADFDSMANGRESQTSVSSCLTDDDQTVPSYKVIHRGHFSLQNYTTDRQSNYSTRPQELVVEIQLPLAKSAASLDLDVFPKRLVLDSQNPKYHLNISLPFPVKDDLGSASFDKSKKILTVVLPVVQPDMPTIEKQVYQEREHSKSKAAQRFQENKKQRQLAISSPSLSEMDVNHCNSTTYTTDDGYFVSKEEGNCSATDSSAVIDSSFVTKEGKVDFDRNHESEIKSYNQESGVLEPSSECSSSEEKEGKMESMKSSDCKSQPRIAAWKTKQRQHELDKRGKDFSFSIANDATTEQMSQDYLLACEKETTSHCQGDSYSSQDEEISVEQMDELPGMFRLPPYTCDQDNEHVSISVKVPGVALENVSLGFTDQKVSLSFPGDITNPLAADWCLLIQLVDNTRINPDEYNFEITDDDVKLTLRKHEDCHGEWNKILAGCSQRTLKEVFFFTDTGMVDILKGLKTEDSWNFTVVDNGSDTVTGMEGKLERLLHEQENSLWKAPLESDEVADDSSNDDIDHTLQPVTIENSVQKDPGIDSEICKTGNVSSSQHRMAWSVGSTDELEVDIPLEELEDDVIQDEFSPRELKRGSASQRAMTRSQSCDCSCPEVGVKVKPILKRCQSLTYDDVNGPQSNSVSSGSENELVQGRRRNKSVSFDMKPTVHEFVQLSKNQWRKQRKAQRKQEALTQLLKEETEKHNKIRESLKEQSLLEGKEHDEVKEDETIVNVKDVNTPTSVNNKEDEVCKEVLSSDNGSTKEDNSSPAKKKNKKKKRRRKGSQSGTSSEDEERHCNTSIVDDTSHDKVSLNGRVSSGNTVSKALEERKSCSDNVLTNKLIFELES